MAVFSGKIIEAYYANSDNDCVEVIYKQDDKAINHYLKVDFNNQDFKDLIEEFRSLEMNLSEQKKILNDYKYTLEKLNLEISRLKFKVETVF